MWWMLVGRYSSRSEGYPPRGRHCKQPKQRSGCKREALHGPSPKHVLPPYQDHTTTGRTPITRHRYNISSMVRKVVDHRSLANHIPSPSFATSPHT